MHSSSVVPPPPRLGTTAVELGEPPVDSCVGSVTGAGVASGGGVNGTVSIVGLSVGGIVMGARSGPGGSVGSVCWERSDWPGGLFVGGLVTLRSMPSEGAERIPALAVVAGAVHRGTETGPGRGVLLWTGDGERLAALASRVIEPSATAIIAIVEVRMARVSPFVDPILLRFGHPAALCHGERSANMDEAIQFRNVSEAGARCRPGH